MLNNLKSIKGFTIIELLLVMSVLGALSLLVINFGPISFEKSRDVKRKSDLKNISTALEVFYNDHGLYPQAFNTSFAACPFNTATNVGVGCNWGTGNFSDTDGHNYYPVLPSDPRPAGILNGNRGYLYTVSPTQQAYRLYALLENPNDPNITSGIAVDCVTFMGPQPLCPQCRCNFVIHSPNTGATSGPWP